MTDRTPLPVRARFRPAARPALKTAGVFAVLLVLGIGYGLYARGFAAIPRTFIALAILAFPPAAVAGITAYALGVARPAARSLTRGIVMALAVSTFGIAASSATFTLQFRANSATAYESLWSEPGLHQLFWTGLATTYMFALTGLHLYLPWGTVAAALAVVLFAIRPPPTLRPVRSSAKDPVSDRQTPKSR